MTITRKWVLPRLAWPTALLLASTALQAVTIRHDVNDRSYTDLARKPALRAGIVTTRPFADTPGSGVLVHPRYVLTAGHVGSVDGPARMPLLIGNREYMVIHVHLCPGYSLKKSGLQGNDIAILALEGKGVSDVRPAVIWTGGIRPGTRFVGIGQGRSGTGIQTDEPLPARTFRAYENRADLILGPEHYSFFIADFDSPDGNANTLAGTVYALGGAKTGVSSSAEPLPLEGSIAAGDSGSGVWIESGTKMYLAGITSGRHYSCYGGQAGYVNLSDERIINWIRSICPDIQTAR